MRKGFCLLSGVDTLVVGYYLYWVHPELLERLRACMEVAKQTKMEQPICLEGPGGYVISFMLQPHGKKGYTWILQGQDYSLLIMDRATPTSRPSLVVEYRSELLWRLGPVTAVQRLQDALQHNGAKVLAVKPSRADLCMDLLFPKDRWNSRLLGGAVTRAQGDCIHRRSRTITGFSIGRGGDLSARLYDKAREIVEQSGKTWFYDLWGLESVPDDCHIIRVEFQLRRPVLRELGCKTLDDFWNALPHLWAYCTQRWLKFQINPHEHHTQQKTQPWWKVVQGSFLGICEGEPLIRAKAIENDKTRLRRQVTGLCSSLIALEQDGGADLPSTREAYPQMADEALQALGKTDAEVQEDVARKHARKARLKAKLQDAEAQRARLGFDSAKPEGAQGEGQA
ncbi:hypothetical protein JCM14635_05500 [Megalodesulfovibrio paquesii]